MDTHYLPYLICPFCQTRFAQTGTMLICGRAHTFDIAREGYVYFLQKKSPGDTKEMLVARRAFLARGYYHPISDMINETISTYLDAQAQQSGAAPLVILDAGCGEGYYLGQVQTYLSTRQVPTTCIGIDISKEAVRLAARSYPHTFGVVANLKERLPFADDSFQVILNVFAPRNPPEFVRIIAPGGLLIVVIPAPTHLHQLRAALHLLAIEENKQQHVIEQFTAQGQFHLETIVPVTYQLDLQKAEIAQIVTMTPNYWHLTDETLQAMQDLAEIRTEIACLGLVFRAHHA